ncbi:hypothetical protein AXG93_4491s1170 [Marchantia polymorpha subsp. ruderalis]|uniref:Uncharacterized protein n=1 Tax=Marchantia polymorpha subsp. ruderalis TaxID=1480154 RepID=A0A176WQE7_MARPO|nr:hypothetical protein AXG93_4491s1170 [Marchantia polymorpha subsp. ruderalis]
MRRGTGVVPSPSHSWCMEKNGDMYGTEHDLTCSFTNISTTRPVIPGLSVELAFRDVYGSRDTVVVSYWFIQGQYDVSHPLVSSSAARVWLDIGVHSEEKSERQYQSVG